MNFKHWLINEEMRVSQAIEALGLEYDFTPEQLKTAFREKSKQHHTDRGGNLRASIDVNAAYDVLRKYLEDENLRTKKSPEESPEDSSNPWILQWGVWIPNPNYSGPPVSHADKMRIFKINMDLDPDKYYPGFEEDYQDDYYNS
jgi:curved DNA-binding protein CbpA